MNSQELSHFLYQESEVELKQKKTGENIVDIDLELFMEQYMGKRPTSLFEMPEYFFFKEGNVYIRKHNRYAPMQEHKHAFLELNYMYSGSCRQWINHEEIFLEEGDIIMLDKGSSHSIDVLGKGDIMVNLLLKFDSINTQVLQRMTSQVSVLATFLAEAGGNQKNYLVFKGNEVIRDLMNLILREYFEGDILSVHQVELYLPILFTELSRSHLQGFQNQEETDYVTQSLKIIEQEYQTVDLQSLAHRIGFNSHYLGNMIKGKTGLTFKQHVQQQRMQTAYQLLIHTNMTIEDICERIGLKDPSYFYQSFKKKYGETPNQVRDRVRTKKL